MVEEKLADKETDGASITLAECWQCSDPIVVEATKQWLGLTEL